MLGYRLAFLKTVSIMFYQPGVTHHGLPFDPFKSCVVPRPIGWISTVSSEGKHNLAPYSQFQNVGFDPPIVMFSANQKTNGDIKDSVANAQATGEFVWNMATYDLRDAVNQSAQELPLGMDEFELAGLTKLESKVVKPMRVAGSPIQFECKVIQTLEFPGNPPMGNAYVVFGQVVGIHIDDAAINELGQIDILKIKPIARMGYYDYTVVDNKFEMVIPGDNKRLLAGLEGSGLKAKL
jgi:flavin reductase (DIM6/NTAB) family NADH-FMN oxidoreductase RutF